MHIELLDQIGAVFSPSFLLSPYHGLMNHIDTKAKCLDLKLLTFKGTLRKMFIRVYRLEVQSVMLVFSNQLCELLPYNLLSGSIIPPPLPCVNKFTVYTYTVCKGGIKGFWASGR